jgi:hypothetical protein
VRLADNRRYVERARGSISYWVAPAERFTNGVEDTSPEGQIVIPVLMTIGPLPWIGIVHLYSYGMMMAYPANTRVSSRLPYDDNSRLVKLGR